MFSKAIGNSSNYNVFWQMAIKCGHHQLAQQIASFTDDDIGELVLLWLPSYNHYCTTTACVHSASSTTELLTQQPVYNPMARVSRTNLLSASQSHSHEHQMSPTKSSSSSLRDTPTTSPTSLSDSPVSVVIVWCHMTITCSLLLVSQ